MGLLDKIKEAFRFHSDSIDKSCFCICCNNYFKTFLPFGIVKRENALCPVCDSLERHRLHWHYINNKTILFKENGKNLKLLHVAPEIIFYNKFMSNNRINYFPCDKFEKGYENAYPPNTINVDITSIQFADNEFDAIYCSHVLEHVTDDKKALKELFRVLKPGGFAIIQVPLDKSRQSTFEDFRITDPQEREKAFGQKDHVRVYGRDYHERLQAAGFVVKIEDYLGNFTEEEIFRNGFMKGEDIYFCKKQNAN